MSPLVPHQDAIAFFTPTVLLLREDVQIFFTFLVVFYYDTVWLWNPKTCFGIEKKTQIFFDFTQKDWIFMV